MYLQDHITAVLRGHGIPETPKAFQYMARAIELYLLPSTVVPFFSGLIRAVAEQYGIQPQSLSRELLFLCRRLRQSDPDWSCRVLGFDLKVPFCVRTLALEALERSRAGSGV